MSIFYLKKLIDILLIKKERVLIMLIRNRILITMSLSCFIPILQAMEPRALIPEKQLDNAGKLVMLANPTDIPGQLVLKHLPIHSLLTLRRTCKALRAVWDPEKLLTFGYGKIVELSETKDFAQGLVNLHEKLRDYPNPIELDLYGRQLKVLPEATFNMTQLKSLLLGYNNMSQRTIAAICDRLRNLKKLSLFNNKLKNYQET